MRAGDIWWGQIGNCLSLLTDVSACIRDSRSVVLLLPENLPWRQTFRDNAAVRRAALGGNRGLRMRSWREGQDPGEFVLRELCSRSERALYYPGDSCAAYLGQREDLEMNEQDIWITGIHRREDMLKWYAFLVEYERVSQPLVERAVFVLEYDGPAVPNPGVEQILFTVEDYDCRVFCLESGATLKNTDLREYQAELALRISGTDPELSWALLRTGEQLIRDPVRTAMEAIEGGRSSEGKRFPVQSEQQILSNARRAALVVFFPVLEQWRVDCVQRHEHELLHWLPITNDHGDKITDPYDLEFKDLAIFCKKPGNSFTLDERAKVAFCRETRNKLAHNKVLPPEDARRILKL